MRTFLLTSVFLFLMPFFLAAQAYFVKLSPAGMQERPYLLTLTGPSALKKQAAPLFKPIVPGSRLPDVLRPWLQIDLRSSQARQQLDSLKARQLIEKIEPVGFFRVHAFTNDSLSGQQWYLKKIGLPAAWQYSEGDSSVVVGVIDTGVDYTHPDLAANIWRNPAEANGQPGVDDDGNGYVDDVVGWDFTDAPGFPDGGDYLTPDPDPSDEFSGGHGTEVAGIIAAVKDNHRGICGIAPKVKIMVLRAGTASGYLEEDDVIRAMIYAQANGARIINMSFGDKQVSSLFHDVLRYLWSKGVVLVTAAGNDGSQVPYFPAAFNETIAVGASTADDWLAGFSNYGNVLDLIAPGVNMLSTAPGSTYNTVNGTSFSAPVVSAVAALILSRHPRFTNEQVRTILKGSATDLGTPGHDPQTGAGRVDALQALQIETSGTLQISRPEPNVFLAESTPVVITANHPELRSVELRYALGQNPEQWYELARTEFHFYRNDTIAFLPVASLPDTLVQLRLTMQLLNDSQIEVLRSVRIDRTPPVLQSLHIIPAYRGTEPLLLCSLTTDDPTALKAELTVTGSEQVQNSIVQTTFTRKHFFTISKEFAAQANLLTIRFHNSAGLPGPEKQIALSFPRDFAFQAWHPIGNVAPPGYLLPHTTDLNHDGQKEIIQSTFTSNGAFGPVHAYEFNEKHFVDRLLTQKPFIPRDAGTFSQDGKSVLLLGMGSYSCLLQADTPNDFPSHLVWQDSSFWAARLSDLDGDGKMEIIGYRDSIYQVLEWDGISHFRKVAALPNPSGGENRLGVPFVRIEDFNRDGQKEIVFGDYDGDVIVYTCSGNNTFTLLATGKALQSDATDLLTCADQRIFALTHTTESENLESQWQQRYWTLETLSVAAHSQSLAQTLLTGFYPYHPKKNFRNALEYWRSENKGFIFAGVYPYLYLLQNTAEGWQPVWSVSSFNSNAIIVEDLNQDGQTECYFNDGQALVGFAQEMVRRPDAPLNLRVLPQDTFRVLLQWDGNAPHGFNIYRGTALSQPRFLSHVSQSPFLDRVPHPGEYYFYYITAVDSTADFIESAPSNLDSARTAPPPRLLRAWQINARQIGLEFDQPMRLLPGLLPTVRLQTGLTTHSVSLLQPETKVLVTFEQNFTENITVSVAVDNFFSTNKIPVDRRFASTLLTLNGQKPPHVAQISIRNRHTVILEFSTPMKKNDVVNLQHYRLTPAGKVVQAIPLDSACTRLELRLSEESMAGGFGQECYLIVQGLVSAADVPMAEPMKFSLVRQVNDLSKIVIYPQPVRPHQKQLIFAKLPQNTQIQIFTINGECVKTFRQVNEAGGVIWNLRDERGRKIHSGIYIYRMVHNSEEKVGKLVIVR